MYKNGSFIQFYKIILFNMIKHNKFTYISHDIRLDLGLSVLEYCLLDSIHHLSNNRKNNGWCNASQKYLGNFFSISTKTAGRYEKKLIDLQLIERNSDNKNEKRTTQKYFNLIELADKKSTSQKGDVDNMTADVDKMSEDLQTNCPKDVDKMSDNNNIYNNKDNNINNNTSIAKATEEKPKTPIPLEDGNIKHMTESQVVSEIIYRFRHIDPLNYKKWFKLKIQQTPIRELLDTYGFEEVDKVVRVCASINGNGDRFAPQVFTPIQLKNKYQSVIAYAKRKFVEKQNKKQLISDLTY